MIDSITAFIFALGVATVALSLYACCQFEKFRKQLSRDADRLSHALSWQLVGESVIGAGTLVFAFGEWAGLVDGWSVETKSTLRFVMFLFTAVTTFHLVRTLRALKNG